MSEVQPLLLAFWVGILTHLWQSTLVLAALALLSRGLRRAPARTAELLWSLGFLKLWLLRRMHESAEFACDESALRGGVSPAVYARALARVVKLGLAPTALSSTLGSNG